MDLASLPENIREKLEDLETQYGPMSGKLALAMDLMSDAEISAGQLSIYCRNGLDPRKPHPDLEQLQLCVAVVRQLVKEAFREERKGKGRDRGAGIRDPK